MVLQNPTVEQPPKREKKQYEINQLEKRKKQRRERLDFYSAEYLGDLERIGQIIQARRLELGISKREIERQCGINAHCLNKIELGQKEIWLNTLYKLSRILQLNLYCMLLPNTRNIRQIANELECIGIEQGGGFKLQTSLYK